jgi:hypothetical protein
VLGYSLALAAMVAIATGLVPALQASKMTVLSGLKEGAARGIGKLRAAFVVSEVAVCLCSSSRRRSCCGASNTRMPSTS